MNQYNEISTLQYMGSKTRIISHICEPIIKNKCYYNEWSGFVAVLGIVLSRKVLPVIAFYTEWSLRRHALSCCVSPERTK